MPKTLHLTGDPEADKLLSSDVFALLTGLLLDQQLPMEHTFMGPKKISDRMGGFGIDKIAEADLEEFVELCVQPPRYPPLRRIDGPASPTRMSWPR